MADQFGMLPTDVLDQPAGLFWLNAQIRHATEQFKNDMKKQSRSAQTEAGTATPAQKQELVEDNEARAERREELGDAQPGLSEQMDQLRDLERGGPS